MINLFTFGVAMYNQENCILDTLNSIKWQIITYGSNYAFSLFIMDDHSKDNSVAVASKWLSDNKALFDNAMLLTNSMNKGVPYNYNRFLDLVVDEHFKFIAGDDILGRNNIFEQYRHVDDGNIDSYFRFCFDSKGIMSSYLDNTYIINFLYKCVHDSAKKFSLKKESRGGYLHTPSTLYSKKLYDDSQAKDLNMQFRLFEDDPTWYSMAKNTRCKVFFIPEVHLLYRISDKSISNSSKKKNAFDQEIYKLHKIYEKKSHGFEKMYWKFKNGTLPKYLRIDKYIDKINQIYETFYILVFHSKEYKALQKYVSNEVMLEQKHLEYIQSMKK